MDRLSFVALACAAVSGCVGGQSGTETGGKFDDLPVNPAVGIMMSPDGCACALGDTPAVALRGRVVSVDDGYVRVRVRALLGEGPVEPRLRFTLGDEIGGVVSEGCEPVGLHPGEDVAVLHTPGDQSGFECPEYRGCMSQRCDRLLAEDPRFERCEPDCQLQTRAQCSTRAGDALLHGRVVIARWGGELSLPLLGRSEEPLRVPAADLTDLLDRNTCEGLVKRALPDGGAPLLPEPGSEDIVADPARGSAAE